VQASEGTPQGGVISPLLANIALHGIEDELKKFAEMLPKEYFGYKASKSVRRTSLTFVRYADDFVVMHQNKAVVQRCREIISDWLRGIGLELKPEKTRLTHTLYPSESEDGKAGFDFLGYHIRQFPASKYKVGKNGGNGVQKTFKTLIIPSKKNQQNHLNVIKTKLVNLKQALQEKIISELNPIIRGWSNYFTFSDTQTVGLFSKS
jgi:RNA-directed DNA polymerase